MSKGKSHIIVIIKYIYIILYVIYALNTKAFHEKTNVIPKFKDHNIGIKRQHLWWNATILHSIEGVHFSGQGAPPFHIQRETLES